MVPQLVPEGTTPTPQQQLRLVDEMPGSPENFGSLLRLLDGWRCCGAPSLCGAGCMDDELSHTLADAYRLIFEAYERQQNEAAVHQ